MGGWGGWGVGRAKSQGKEGGGRLRQEGSKGSSSGYRCISCPHCGPEVLPATFSPNAPISLWLTVTAVSSTLNEGEMDTTVSLCCS